MKHQLAKLRAAVDSAHRDLDDLRDRIADLKDQREQLAIAPVDRAEVERRVSQEIGQALNPDPLHVFKHLAAREPHRPEIGFNQLFQRDPFRMLCALLPNQMREAVVRAALPSDGMAMTVEAWTSALTKIDRQIFAAEVAEELACREIESTGATMPRRQDADVRILLAPTHELQG